jgi:hypothetical protein
VIHPRRRRQRRRRCARGRLSYRHLVADETDREPLLSTDRADPGRVPSVPSEWLAGGWAALGERDSG